MRIIHLIGAALLLIASPAMAKDAASWIVAQKSGDVRVVRNGLQPASVQVREALAPGEILETGPTGRAMLTRGGDYVVVAPDSRLLLPQKEEAKGFTRLIQQVGTMLYKVRHTGVPHFAVNTPMLAAVVKGTTFTIVVDKDRAAVQVNDGVVEVSSLNGAARRLVEGGMTVYIGRERPNEIVPMKAGATSLPAPARPGEVVKVESSGDVPLSTVTDLTGGLVREAPTAPVVATTITPAPALPASIPASNAVQPTAVDAVTSTVPAVTDPATGIVDAVAPTVTDPVVDIVHTVAPTVATPVVEIIDTTVPAITQPVVEIVETTVPAITQPVVEIVDTTVPAITQPVVEIVETAVPAITQPVVEIVDTTIPVVTQPVVDIVQTAVPAVTQPVTGLITGLLGGP